MEMTSLGKTDLRVSKLCMGSMQFGWTADEAASFAVLDAFVAAGGNFIDTADIYSNWVPGNTGGDAEDHHRQVDEGARQSRFHSHRHQATRTNVGGR